MTRRKEKDERGEMMQGTLDMLILRTVLLAPAHGHTIAYAIERTSEDVLQVEHGSLYPALHRLEAKGWITSTWDKSDNNRRAKYYKLTATGRKHLAEERETWARFSGAIERILQTT